MKLKILVVSDFHGSLTSAEETNAKAESEGAEVIVVCGDVTHFGNVSMAERVLKKIGETRIPTIFVPGNCDPEELASMDFVGGSFCIHGRHTRVLGLEFIGVGGSTLGPFHTPIEFEEEAISSFLERAYDELEDDSHFVLVSHTPPLNTNVDLLRSGSHAGSTALRQFIEKKKPLSTLCGHIHEARGVDNIAGAPVVNPGPSMWGLCALVDINTVVNIDLSVLREKG